MSGSGKSYYAGQLVESYNKIYPSNKVFLFSNKEEDPALDKHKLIRIKLDDSLVEDPIKLKELENSCVIFDDVEAIPSKKLAIELDRLRDLILQQGRSLKVNFIYIAHIANNHSKTRTILNEMHSITIFPAMTTKYSLKYLLERYFGFDKEQIRKINGLPSRWVTIYKAPFVALHEQGAYLV